MTPKQLRRWRKRNGYTQEMLARHLGVDEATVSKWEHGVLEDLPAYLDSVLELLEKERGNQ